MHNDTCFKFADFACLLECWGILICISMRIVIFYGSSIGVPSLPFQLDSIMGLKENASWTLCSNTLLCSSNTLLWKASEIHGTCLGPLDVVRLVLLLHPRLNAHPKHTSSLLSNGQEKHVSRRIRDTGHEAVSSKRSLANTNDAFDVIATIDWIWFEKYWQGLLGISRRMREQLT